MKNNYHPNNLTRRQKKLKKRIPYGPYCHKYNGAKSYEDYICPYWLDLGKNVKHNRNYCEFRTTCDEDCDTCTEPMTYCTFLKYGEYGQYPLGDACKVCGIHTNLGKREEVKIRKEENKCRKYL